MRKYILSVLMLAAWVGLIATLIQTFEAAGVPVSSPSFLYVLIWCGPILGGLLATHPGVEELLRVLSRSGDSRSG